MVWQKIDDQFGVSKKVTRIPRKQRLAAVGLWELAANYSVRALTDAVLDENELDEVLATPALTDLLIRVDLWHGTGHECDRCAQPPAGGIVIHDLLVYNPDVSSVKANRDIKSEGGKQGNHIRWHERRGITDPSCDWCAIGDRFVVDVASDSLRNPPGPVPGPVPERPTDIGTDTQSSPDPNVRAFGPDEFNEIVTQRAQRAGIQNLGKLYALLTDTVNGHLSPTGAIELAEVIVSRSQQPVKDVDRYVASSCQKSPDDVQWHYDRLDLGVA